MTIVKWLGVLGFLGGLVLAGFHAIGRLMGSPEGFYSESIAGFAGEGGLEWIGSLPFEFLRNGVDFIVQVPFYMVLIGVGLLLLIIHGLFAKS
ncbi:MAG: hypothetical protein K9J85_04235 [Desulfobacteraceae bacterium]|nr:hypothetical protein [Desulfobacteraceae bacterium]